MKILKFLFSGAFMGVLLVVFAFVIGYATFIENDYDAITAKMLVYNAWWFELILLLMVVNLTGMVFTRRLYSREKLNILIIHISLVIIMIGAAITRYIGFEGQMHIRNGQTTNKFYSSDTYLLMTFDKAPDEEYYEDIVLSNYKNELLNKTYQVAGKKVEAKVDNYMPNGVRSMVKVQNGDPFISIVAAGASGRIDVMLKEGDSEVVSGLGMTFGDTTKRDHLAFVKKDTSIFMKIPFALKVADMNNQLQATYEANELVPVETMRLYMIQNATFVVKELIENGAYSYHPSHNEGQGGTRIIALTLNGKKTMLEWGKTNEIQLDDMTVTATFGMRPLELPFSLKLNEFQLERYPGSNSPSSFASEITLIDEKNKVEEPYRIYMNNILSYGGYRFYQSSYDRDEKGTILSVNHDYWGTIVTYIGYFLLFASMLASFVVKKNRFANVLQQIQGIHKERKKIQTLAVCLLLALSYTANAQQDSIQGTQQEETHDHDHEGHDHDHDHDHNHEPSPPPEYEFQISEEHAMTFGRLLVQDNNGRMIPINTMATNVLLKVYKGTSFEGLSPEQAFLGMLTNHMEWQEKAFIFVNNEQLANKLGLTGKYAKFNNFFDNTGQYTLQEEVDKTYAKKPATRTQYDKELLNVNERINVFFMTLRGSILKILPIPGHPQDKWAHPGEFIRLDGKRYGVDSLMFNNYYYALNDARKTNDFAEADKALKEISDFQQKNGIGIVPSEGKVSFEIFYNKINIFYRLFPLYLMLGTILSGLFFYQLFKPQYELKWPIRIIFYLLLAGFATHTGGLILRWYVAGHAPWSDGYESMIYISWVTVLSGFLFMRKSIATVAVTSMLAGVTLLTAHMSWMNPEITNLVPVLKSYWLTIHVATITASYGFFGLAAMMGFFNMLIMILRNHQNRERLNMVLSELTLIIELALHTGLVLLVLGNFLGGIWANESWGRYWGWDPKETWTLVTVIFYSFVLHLRLVPSMKNLFTSNFFSLIGFGCILMTYFGVNYFLSGLHSYAGGDPVSVPSFVYYILMVVFVISALAAYNEFNADAATPVATDPEQGRKNVDLEP